MTDKQTPQDWADVITEGVGIGRVVGTVLGAKHGPKIGLGSKLGGLAGAAVGAGIEGAASQDKKLTQAQIERAKAEAEKAKAEAERAKRETTRESTSAQNWADQIAEVSHSLGEGLFGNKDGKTYKTPGVITDPSKRARDEKPPNKKPIPKNVLVRTGQGTSQTDRTT
jgi:hypothetical protein